MNVFKYIIFPHIILVYNVASGSDHCYVAGFSEDIEPCDGFENKFIQCDSLKLGHGDDDKTLGLEGFVNLVQAIDEEYEVEVTVFKKMDLVNELFFTSAGNICKSLRNKDTPWYTLLQALNVTKCPIPVKQYNVSNMALDLHYAEGIMTHEFCGEYLAEMSITKDVERLSCYVIQLQLSEVDCQK